MLTATACAKALALFGCETDPLIQSTSSQMSHVIALHAETEKLESNRSSGIHHVLHVQLTRKTTAVCRPNSVSRQPPIVEKDPLEDPPSPP